MNSEIGACCPRDPLNVTQRFPARSKAGLSTMCNPVASGTATSIYAVSPGTSSRRTGVRPPSRPAGTTIAIASGEMRVICAGCPPMRTAAGGST
jgi:hypothetical protein